MESDLPDAKLRAVGTGRYWIIGLLAMVAFFVLVVWCKMLGRK